MTLGTLALATGVPIGWLRSYGAAHQLAHLFHAVIGLLFTVVLLGYAGRHYAEVTGHRGATFWLVLLFVYMVVREVFLREALPLFIVATYVVPLALAWWRVDRQWRRPIVLCAIVAPPLAFVILLQLGRPSEAITFPLFYYGELLCLVAAWAVRPGVMPARGERLAAVVRSGALLVFTAIAACLSGLFLGVGAGQMRVGPTFVAAHLIVSVAFAVAAVAHLTTITRARRFARADASTRVTLRGWARVGVVASTCLAAIFVLSVSVARRAEPVREPRSFDAQSMAQPSRWEAVGAVPDRAVMAAPEVCFGCHPTQGRQWLASAHHFSMSPLVRVLVREARAKLGSAGERYCLGCHAPSAVILGESMGEGTATAATLDAGITCGSCHALEGATQPLGNGSHRVGDDPQLLFEQPGSYQTPLTNILFKLTPKLHRRRYAKDYLRDPRLCGGCHLQELGPPVTADTSIVQDTYGPWSRSAYAEARAAGGGPVACIDCHMPYTSLSEYQEPIRDHRVLGGTAHWARQRGDEPTARRVDAWLAGDRATLIGAARVEFREHWERMANPTQLGAVSDRAFAETVEGLYQEKLSGHEFPPENLVPGGSLLGVDVAIEGTSTAVVAITNRSIGHDFPSAPGDLADAWVAVRAETRAGVLIADRGGAGLDGPPPGELSLGREPRDREGRPIERHRLWEVASHGDRPVVGPRATTRVRVSLPELAGRTEPLTVRAQVLWRLPGAAIVRAVQGPDAPLAAPVVLGEASIAVPRSR